MRRSIASCTVALLVMSVAAPAAATTASGVRVSGQVWLDLDGDGSRDAGEPGRAGVSVSLRTTATILDAVTTDADGAWSFAQVQPGTYQVAVTPPIDHDVTTGQPMASGSAQLEVTVADADVAAPEVGLGSPVASGPDITTDVALDAASTDGDERSWTVRVHNIGPGSGDGLVDVRLVLSSGHVAVAAAGTGWTCDLGDNIVTCEAAGGIPAGSSLPSLAVTSRTTGSLGNTIALTATARLDGVFDAAPLNDEDSATAIVSDSSDTADVDGDGDPDLSNAGAPAQDLGLVALLALTLGVGALGLAGRRET